MDWGRLDWGAFLQGAAGVALIGLVGVLIKEWLGYRQGVQTRSVERDKVSIAMAGEQRQQFETVIKTYQGLLQPLQEHARAVDEQLMALREQLVATEKTNAAAVAVTQTRIAILGHEHATCLEQVLYLSTRMAALEASHVEAGSSGDAQGAGG